MRQTAAGAPALCLPSARQPHARAAAARLPALLPGSCTAGLLQACVVTARPPAPQLCSCAACPGPPHPDPLPPPAPAPQACAVAATLPAPPPGCCTAGRSSPPDLCLPAPEAATALPLLCQDCAPACRVRRLPSLTPRQRPAARRSCSRRLRRLPQRLPRSRRGWHACRPQRWLPLDRWMACHAAAGRGAGLCALQRARRSLRQPAWSQTMAPRRAGTRVPPSAWRLGRRARAGHRRCAPAPPGSGAANVRMHLQRKRAVLHALCRNRAMSVTVWHATDVCAKNQKQHCARR